MSAKWVRSQQWDREHLTGVLTPLRVVLWLFSTIRLAVTLLILVSLYGVAASIPVGILALAPTYLAYGVILIAFIGVVAAVPTWLVTRLMAGAGLSRAARFGAALPTFLGLGVAGVWAWSHYLWPLLNYNSAAGTGFRFFADFVEHWKAVTLRRLPGMEMSELEFYAWWPLSLILWLFIINMIVTTVRRIEFRIEKAGVLSVHTGIVMLALGSAYYGRAKQEGDVLLMAGEFDPVKKKQELGPPAVGFYDNTRVVLQVAQGKRGPSGQPLIEQRLLEGLPRYNEYGLGALDAQVGTLPQHPMALTDEGRTLAMPVASSLAPEQPRAIDDDIQLRVVGYAPYVEISQAWEVEGPKTEPGPGEVVRFLNVSARRPGADGASTMEPLGDPLELQPLRPALRVMSMFEDLLTVEYTRGMSDNRWALLSRALPVDNSPSADRRGTPHAILIEIPEQNVSKWVPAAIGAKISVGNPAWSVLVRSIAPKPSNPFITPGYTGAVSSEMVVEITPPADLAAGEGWAPGAPFDRFIFARYPELNQDIGQSPRADGRADRRKSSDVIRIAHLDASIAQVFVDEQASADGLPGGEPRMRAIVRLPGGQAQLFTDLKPGASIPVGQPTTVQFTLGERYDNAKRVAVPLVTPAIERENENLGNHKRAALAVEITVPGRGGQPDWTLRRWLQFRQYRGLSDEEATKVTLPDGRVLELAFGRLWRPLPNLRLHLAAFEMFPYPHSTQPRDFRSDLVIEKVITDEQGRPVKMEAQEAYTSLNDPLLVSPFVWQADRAWPLNALGWLGDRLGATRFKFSQSGWDAQGWNDTKPAVERGQLPRPLARFTILGVGNNPGIYIIATGAVLMGVGIPYAFYVKPWILKRRKLKIQKQVAAGTYRAPTRAPIRAATNGSTSHTNGHPSRRQTTTSAEIDT